MFDEVEKKALHSEKIDIMLKFPSGRLDLFDLYLLHPYYIKVWIVMVKLGGV